MVLAVPPLTFVRSDLVSDEAAAVFAAHELVIRRRLPDVEVRHHGGTSMLGLLTSGDVDLHVRARRESFETARDALSDLYQPLFPDEWDADVAYYVAPDSQPPVEIVLTVIGSVDDLYHRDAWQRIASDPHLLERYNGLKREHEGGSVEAYKAAKRELFHEIVRTLGAGP